MGNSSTAQTAVLIYFDGQGTHFYPAFHDIFQRICEGYFISPVQKTFHFKEEVSLISMLSDYSKTLPLYILSVLQMFNICVHRVCDENIYSISVNITLDQYEGFEIDHK